MTAPGKRRWLASPLSVGLVSLLLIALFVGRNLVEFDGDPTVFITIGEESGPARDYAELLLGNDVHLTPEIGHDGRFFFAQANDPFLTDPDEHAAVLDRPVYRYQRMLFPTLAGLFGLLSPWGVVWGMLTLSLLTFGAGTYAAAMVARGMGGSAWWGLAFGLNVGVLSELLVGGSGHLAAALLFAAVAALQRDRPGWSTIFLTLAVLTREVMLVGAFGIGSWLWQQRRRRWALRHWTVPLLAAGAWAVFVRSRIGWKVGADEVEEIGWPLGGVIEALGRWSEDPLSAAVGLVVLAVLVLFCVRMLKAPSLVGYAVVGFVPLALVLTSQVWLNYFNISRAVSPLITAYLLMAFAARDQPSRPVGLA